MPSAPRTVRLNVLLSLTRAERRAFDALCAAQLRTPGGAVSRIVSQHLASRANPLADPIPAGMRPGWSVKVRLTAPERRELERRAAADGRSLGNLATVLVAQAIRPTTQ